MNTVVSGTVHHEDDNKASHNIPGVYKPLDPSRKEIRVLCVNGETKAPNDRLRCHLETISLLESPCPFYEATSWCWGESSERGCIEIDDIPIQIPVNALEPIRELCITHKRSRIWIDAVCINQDDMVERALQVSFMGDVYSKAACVLVWLGKSDLRSPFECVDILSTQARNAVGELKDLPRSPLRYDDSLPDACDEHALHQLYTNPWFTRLWVFQEAVLAAHAICYLGHQSIDLRDVLVAAIWLTRGIYGPKGKWPERFDRGISQAKVIFSCRELGGKNSLLNWLLAVSMSLEAADGRDKVFGIRGLMKQSFEFWQRNSKHLEPDYSKSLKDVYIGATLASIDASGQLLMPRYAAAQAPTDNEKDLHIFKNEAWPSWVPRFDVFRSEEAGAANLIPRVNGLGASNGAKLQFAPSTASTELKLRGIVLEQVTYVSPIIWDQNHDSTDQLADTLYKIWGLVQTNVKSDVSITFREFAHTLVCRYPDRNDPNNGNDDLEASIDAFEKYCQIKSARGHGVEDEEPTVELLLKDAEIFLRINWRRSINRVIFASRSGRIGLGPPRLSENDRVCIIFGEIVPIVLRFDDANHTPSENCVIVGDAFIHGVMKGEATKSLQEAGLLEKSMQWFTIR